MVRRVAGLRQSGGECRCLIGSLGREPWDYLWGIVSVFPVLFPDTISLVSVEEQLAS